MKNNWINIIRPKTLPASVSPVILGLACTIFLGYKIQVIDGVLCLLCALFMQISTNLVNDYIDDKTGVDDKRTHGPQRLAGNSNLKPEQVKKAFTFTFFVSFMLGIKLMITGGTPIIIIGFSSLIAAYAYTGGPYPLSYYALGEVAAFLFFGPVAVWGTYFIQTKQFDFLPVIIGFLPGLVSAAIMAINNLRDLESDSQTRKKTLAIFLGKKWAKYLPLTFVSLALILNVLLSFNLNALILLTAIVPIIVYLKYAVGEILNKQIGPHLNNVLANTGKLMFIHSMLLGFAISFS